MMNKDKELLLPIEASNSESDDVVEEYKLPPPRSRRPRVRKAVAEARIASNSSLCTWKCCFTFFIVTVFISSVLVISFFMLSMQSEINQLRMKVEKAYGRIDQNSAMEVSSKKLMVKLDEYKLKFSKQDLNIKLLAHQILQLNLTLRKSTSSKSFLLTDVDLLKSGMATTGGDIAKMQAAISEHSEQMDSILIELKNVKIALYNASAKNPAALKRLIRPISAQTQAISKLKNVINQFNKTHNRDVTKLAYQVYKNSMIINKHWVKVKVMIDSLNRTHITDLYKVGKYMGSFKNTTENNIEKYTTSNFNGILQLKNITKALQEEVDHHHQLMNNYKYLSSSYGDNISQLKNDSKRFDDLLMYHGHMLQAYGKEIDSLIKHSDDSAERKVMKTTMPGEVKTKEPLTINVKSEEMTPSLAPSIIMKSEETTTSFTAPITIKLEETATTSFTPPITVIKSEETIQPKSATTVNPIKTEHISKEACPILCDVGSYCAKGNTGYACVCRTGFIFKTKFCEDIDECTKSNHCHLNASCKNTFGSYTCTCKDGFHGNGTHCDAKAIERCILKPETGLCRAYFERFFYNSTNGKCGKFVYGGCGGNDNNFETIGDCTLACAINHGTVSNKSSAKPSIAPSTEKNVTILRNVTRREQQPNVTSDEIQSSVTNTSKTTSTNNSIIANAPNITEKVSHIIPNITAKTTTESRVLIPSTKSTVSPVGKSTIKPSTEVVEKDSPITNVVVELDTVPPTTESDMSPDIETSPDVPDESKAIDFNELARKTLRDQKAKEEREADYTEFHSVGKDKTRLEEEEAMDLNSFDDKSV